ncbi:MAG: TRAFs-binding domain-containing protein [Ferruginibacter sp.]
MPDEIKKRCFVVMGFGEKTDFATGRVLDLNKSYRLIIKKAVEAAGLECIRADDIIHAGIIDKPMYELLYDADVVVADLSTSNANAIYELGVRHALKPNTTIVIAESQFKFPFDISHLLVRSYEHLGKGIDGEEADRACEALTKAIMTLAGTKDVDSPVYTFLPNLNIPVMGAVAGGVGNNVDTKTEPKDDETVSMLMEMFMEARKAGNWLMCIGYLQKLLEKKPKDNFLLQQLALCTYKSKQPGVGESLDNAKKILENLNPQQTTDPETLGLWGAVHKRLWEVRQNRTDLDESIWAYEKGFYLKNDYYNGINYAFQLNARAAILEKREAIADVVNAERVRKKVIDICNNILNPDKDQPGQKQFIENKADQFWIEATLVEAYFGIGNKDKSDELKNKIAATVPEGWMIGSLNEQLEKLSKLIEIAPVD